MEPWEALDVDDSDLPFLLRPCKRPHGHQPPISISATLDSRSRSQAVLTPCSYASKTLEDEEEPLPPPPQHQQQQNFDSASHSNSERFCSIPGPAGAIQLAMLRKIRNRENRDVSSSGCVDINPIPTQEYIKRAFENDPKFDDDFNRDPWLSALQYCGTVNGGLPAVPLKHIKERKSVRRIDQVVAIIGSCSQNSRGGLMVTLKDPTGIIGAYIHHKVLHESNFAKCLHVGSVLVLQKVSVFSPSKSVHYLNIMLSNMVKVFTKDSALLSEQNASTKSAGLGEECSQRARSLEKTCSIDNGTCKDRLEPYTNRRGSLQENAGSCEDFPEIYTNRRGSCHENAGENSSGQHSEGCSRFMSGVPVPKEPLGQKPDASEGLSEAAAKNKSGDSEQGLSWGYSHDKVVSEKEIGGIVGQNQRQPVISSASLPQWTDEQLAELFAGDDMGDCI